ncbi:uncharacterized protein LOC132171296 [Corylus avellana]|uniref:uncharacterized protein LOC132171296 n=1 Tax=Corylus avellana TaxID=13451 RepID=UPI00286D1250|nr:uncharacterized protein LOC132171296 [Corylus avellana]
MQTICLEVAAEVAAYSAQLGDEHELVPASTQRMLVRHVCAESLGVQLIDLILTGYGYSHGMICLPVSLLGCASTVQWSLDGISRDNPIPGSLSTHSSSVKGVAPGAMYCKLSPATMSSRNSLGSTYDGFMYLNH